MGPSGGSAGGGGFDGEGLGHGEGDCERKNPEGNRRRFWRLNSVPIRLGTAETLGGG